MIERRQRTTNGVCARVFRRCAGTKSWPTARRPTPTLCPSGHSSNEYRANQAGFQQVGENLYSGTDVLHGIALFAEERLLYEFGTEIAEDNFTPIGHYTQMVWSDTTDVGCAVGDCGMWRTVCWYGPAGNYLGEAPYGESGRRSAWTSAMTTSSNSEDAERHGSRIDRRPVRRPCGRWRWRSSSVRAPAAAPAPSAWSPSTAARCYASRRDAGLGSECHLGIGGGRGRGGQRGCTLHLLSRNKSWGGFGAAGKQQRI